MPDLTPDEILNILCALNQRIDTLNDTMFLMADKISEQMNFQDTEILKTRMNELTYGQKIPRKRIESLEKSIEILSHELSIDSLKRELDGISIYVSQLSKKIVSLEESSKSRTKDNYTIL